MSIINIPDPSLVILCGPAGCGKSTFAKNNFSKTQIISSDRCRAIISDDESNMSVSSKAFKLFHLMIDMRLSIGKLTVADSTALTRAARKKLKKIADKHNIQTILVLFDVPLEHCLRQNTKRERFVDPAVIKKHTRQLKKVMSDVPNEGYTNTFLLKVDEFYNTRVNLVKYQYNSEEYF